MTACTIDACERPHKARGYCGAHYTAARRRDDPSVTVVRGPRGTCSVDDCDRPHVALGMCSMHWQRQHRGHDLGTADPLVERYPDDALCSVDGCARRPNSRWLCTLHGDRLREVGDTGPVGLQRASAGSGHRRTDGYVEVRVAAEHPLARRGRTLLHRLLLWQRIGPGEHACHWCSRTVRWSVGVAGAALVVDHVNFDTRDNSEENLVPSCHPCNSGRCP